MHTKLKFGSRSNVWQPLLHGMQWSVAGNTR